MLVNFTPHPITVIINGQQFVVTSSGVARVATTEQQVGSVTVNGTEVPLVKTVFGAVENLPAPREGILFVVSSIVRAACPDRTDLVSPSRFVRDGEGRIIGCAAFTI